MANVQACALELALRRCPQEREDGAAINADARPHLAYWIDRHNRRPGVDLVGACDLAARIRNDGEREAMAAPELLQRLHVLLGDHAYNRGAPRPAPLMLAL